MEALHACLEPSIKKINVLYTANNKYKSILNTIYNNEFANGYKDQ
jgi:hypothetical protein